MIVIQFAKLSHSIHTKLLERYLPLFPLDFQNHIIKYRHWQSAQASILGRILLQIGSRELGESNSVYDKITYNKYNKPIFKHSPIQFNISHAGDWVVCALDELYDIGIDIEKLIRINIDDFKDQMTLNEWQVVTQAGDSQKAFYDYWTKKEAVLKTIGAGHSIPLHSFEVVGESATLFNKSYYLRKICLEDKYICHVCSEGHISNRSIKIAIVEEKQLFEETFQKSLDI